MADLARAALPEVGSIEGIVLIRHGEGARSSAAGIPVSLDKGRYTTTDGHGHYRFPQVAQGAHVVAIDLERLAAEYDPTLDGEKPVNVFPLRLTHADFEVEHLSEVAGQVDYGKEVRNVVVRLEPEGRYTVTEKDGHFVFENVREGPHQVWCDSSSLPKDYAVNGRPGGKLEVACGRAAAIDFRVVYSPSSKPVRTVSLDSGNL